MSRCRPFTLLLAVLVMAVAVPTSAGAASRPSEKRCKALKAKKHKTRRDRTTLKKCPKAAAARKKSVAPKPVATPAPHGPAPQVAPVPIAPVADPIATPTPSPTPVAPVPTPTVPELPTGTGRAVQVRGFEFGLNLSRAQVLTGTVRVEYNLSTAEDPHTLVLSRVDGTGAHYRFDEQGSRSVVAKSLALTPGRWRLVCDLPGHAAAGMQTELDVR